MHIMEFKSTMRMHEVRYETKKMEIKEMEMNIILFYNSCMYNSHLVTDNKDDCKND